MKKQVVGIELYSRLGHLEWCEPHVGRPTHTVRRIKKEKRKISRSRRLTQLNGTKIEQLGF